MSPRQGSNGIDPERIAALLAAERDAFAAKRPNARQLFERAKRSQLNGIPTFRVGQAPPPIPIAVERAEGCRIWDTDGHVYADFALSGSAALFGHCHPKVVAAIREQAGRAIVSDWPSEDHAAVAEQLQEHFGLPYWRYTLSASDANRFVLRLARIATGRQHIVVFSNVYHGALDETHALWTPDGMARPKGVIRNGFDIAETTRVVRFNDVAGVERALAEGDVAAVLVEPAVTTRRGMVMPDPGFHDALRRLTRAAGALLIVDETQTMVAGPGGFTREFGLSPDILTIGKWAAGGLPVGAYGMSQDVADRVRSYGGQVMGSTLAGNLLTTHVMRVALGEIITAESYRIMRNAAARYASAVRALIARHSLPWFVTELGGRVAVGFDPDLPHAVEEDISDAEAEIRGQLNHAIWHFLANRGVLVNIWDCTSLFCPLVDDAAVELHIGAVTSVIEALVR